jgi:hypothetical protein
LLPRSPRMMSLSEHGPGEDESSSDAPSSLKPVSSDTYSTSPIGVEEQWTMDDHLGAMAQFTPDKEDPPRKTGWSPDSDDYGQ